MSIKKDNTKEELIQKLKESGVLETPSIIEAFEEVDRVDFVPEKMGDYAYYDEAMPIGDDQTISQPSTVAFMLEKLQPKKGDLILDVGYGSGWQTALLASIVGESGKVYAMEIVENLCKIGKKNISKYKEIEKIIDLRCDNADDGVPEILEQGGFDCIVSAAAVEEVPEAWRTQLKIGGTLVYPMKQSIFVETKKKEDKFSVKENEGFLFVPFTTEERGY